MGVGGGQQVGAALIDGVYHASLWSGSAGSWVDLAPAGANHSEAFGIGGGQQVGIVVTGGVNRASLWNGSAGSWVDLHPAGADASYCFGVHGGMQAGLTDVNGIPHASVWSGSAASYTDLHSFLPPGFTQSQARGIWRDASGNTYVVGHGLYGSLDQHQALMWVATPASLCYANCDASTVSPVLTANDFTCFLLRYAAGNTRANCDGATVAPVLTANDFQCFLNAYAAGCP
jgi:hypothetical protein